MSLPKKKPSAVEKRYFVRIIYLGHAGLFWYGEDHTDDLETAQRDAHAWCKGVQDIGNVGMLPAIVQLMEYDIAPLASWLVSLNSIEEIDGRVINALV